MMDARNLSQVLIFAVGLIFGAGGAWVRLRMLKRDVNGIGRKNNRLMLMLLALTDDPEKRRWMAQFLRD